MTPQDNLSGQKNNDLPTTKLYIGMQVNPKAIVSPWARKQILRREIKRMRTIVNKGKKQGYHANEGNTFHPYNKNQIREKMYVVDNAYVAEVCGIRPQAMHIMDTVGNQCYIPGVPCAASGVDYYAYILFRAELNGNQVGYIPGDQHYLFSERECLKNVLTKVGG
jgi:hypothetical protein